MKKVVLGYLLHREKEWLSIVGPDEKVFNAYMKRIKAIWTRTHKCYLLPCNKNMAERLSADLFSNYTVDVQPLREGLLSRRLKTGLSANKVHGSGRPGIEDHDAGLSDWELRYK